MKVVKKIAQLKRVMTTVIIIKTAHSHNSQLALKVSAHRRSAPCVRSCVMCNCNNVSVVIDHLFYWLIVLSMKLVITVQAKAVILLAAVIR